MRPHLMNPQDVTYYELTDSTADMHGYAEHEFEDGVELEGQVTWFSMEQRAKQAEFGEALDSKAKVTFRTEDLTDAEATPTNGDQLAVPGPGGGTERLTVVEVRPHSPLGGEFLLTDVYLAEEGDVTEES